jgi:hypothetical protein
MDKKFELKEALPEDQIAFKQGLEELLTKLTLVFNVNIIKVPVGIKMEDGSIKNVFADEPTIILQKKVEVVEPETPKITDIKATEVHPIDPATVDSTPTISPYIGQPNTDENNSTPA